MFLQEYLSALQFEDFKNLRAHRVWLAIYFDFRFVGKKASQI